MYLRDATGWDALEQIAKFRLHVTHLVQPLNKLFGLIRRQIKPLVVISCKETYGAKSRTDVTVLELEMRYPWLGLSRVITIRYKA